MKRYFLTKWNPAYLDEYGTLPSKYNEWSSISDIGKMQNGEVLTEEEYIHTENAIISSLLSMMQEVGVSVLYTMHLEKKSDLGDYLKISELYHTLYTDHMKAVFLKITEGMPLDGQDLADAMRLILREHFWCGLYARTSHFLVRFCYDLDVDIVCMGLSEPILSNIQTKGLYIRVVEEYM